jgi:hypothetical protein
LEVLLAWPFGVVARPRVDFSDDVGFCAKDADRLHSESRYFDDDASTDPASIVITKADLTRTYRRDLDYSILEFGGTIEIHRRPAGRIADGETVWVECAVALDKDRSVQCSTCHDPHEDRWGSFLTSFRDTGQREGNCTLRCHGREHDQQTYSHTRQPESKRNAAKTRSGNRSR